ncbi:DUF1223 domain-containing protein [Sulfitobacter sp. LCG007]
MIRFLSACAAALLLSAPVNAEEGAPARSTVVVELFTSQGCSSCPPADELMEELAKRDDVIALALHVDYWDYIGWKDDFADPKYAQRQKKYAMRAGRHSIYTPQMIVNGTTDIVGTHPKQLEKAIAEHRARPAAVDLDLHRDGDVVTISAVPLRQDMLPMDVQLLRYQPARQAEITRGENAGKTIHYVNVTEGWTLLGQWDGKAPFRMTADAEGSLPVVVLIQVARFGPILAAAETR